MTSELTRMVPLSKIGSEELAILVRATPEECAAVATRMGLPAIQSLECFFNLTAEDGGVIVFAHGRLLAKVTRVCVVSADEFETSMEEEFTIRFVPAGTENDDPTPDLPDEVPYELDVIDLGEATTEQLGLALDPYPRMEGAMLPDSDDDASDSPFSVLSQRLGSDKTRH